MDNLEDLISDIEVKCFDLEGLSSWVRRLI